MGMVMPLKIHESKESKIHESKRNIMNLSLRFMNLRENSLKIHKINLRLRFTKLLLDSWNFKIQNMNLRLRFINIRIFS